MTHHPDLDPTFIPILDAMASMPTSSSLSPAEARTLWADAQMGEGESVWQVRDMVVPGLGGGIPARLYVPHEPTALILYMHGGGWVMGDLEQHDPAVRAFANRTRAAILSINYRLAPENPFPAALEDAHAALEWMHAHSFDLVARRGLPLLVAGDSAGGNLAAALSLVARNRGGSPIDGQILIYPVLDGRCDTPSWSEHEDCRILLATDMRWYWAHYTGKGSVRLDPRASPRQAASHAALPKTLIALAGIDILRDEGREYAGLLSAAGTDVTLLIYDALPHGFFNFSPFSPAAAAAFDELSAETRALIARLSRHAQSRS